MPLQVRNMRSRAAVAAALSVTVLAAPSAFAKKDNEVELDGYAEMRKGNTLVVEGQRVRPGPKCKIKGEAKSFESIPLGWEVEVEGIRAADGVIEATEIKAEPNDVGMGEEDLVKGSTQAETAWRSNKAVFETDQNGRRHDMGRIDESGPRWKRVRSIMDQLLPPYIPREKVRVYVVETADWNAFAMPNFGVFVNAGLIDDFNDDELAVVLGHELAHATHEHSRRQQKKSMLMGIGAVAVAVGAEAAVKNDDAKTAIQAAALISPAILSNKFSREHEDQADRVGLRYAYEAGFDTRVAPGIWQRFAQKYGEGSKLENAIFGDHSLATQRQREMNNEVALNYSGTTDTPTRNAIRTAANAPAATGTVPDQSIQVVDAQSGSTVSRLKKKLLGMFGG